MAMIELEHVWVQDADDLQTFTVFPDLGRVEVDDETATWVVGHKADGIGFLEQRRGQVVFMRDPQGHALWGELDFDVREDEIEITLTLVEERTSYKGP